jgi:hypothetical protein
MPGFLSSSTAADSRAAHWGGAEMARARRDGSPIWDQAPGGIPGLEKDAQEANAGGRKTAGKHPHVLAGAAATVILVGAAFAVPQPWYLLVVVAALAPYPTGLGVAVLRDHLWDVDLVLRRSVIYALLTACIIGAYALAIVALGGLLGRAVRVRQLARSI